MFICALILLAGVISTGIRIAKGVGGLIRSIQRTRRKLPFLSNREIAIEGSQNLEKQNLFVAALSLSIMPIFPASAKNTSGEYTFKIHEPE